MKRVNRSRSFSGRQSFKDIEANKFYLVEEGAPSYEYTTFRIGSLESCRL